jgi:hypothetical protein
MARTSNIQWDDNDIRFVLDQHAELVFFSAISLKFEPTSLRSSNLNLRAKPRSNKYQFFSLWFDPIETWTHDLPHLKPTNHCTTIVLNFN